MSAVSSIIQILKVLDSITKLTVLANKSEHNLTFGISKQKKSQLMTLKEAMATIFTGNKEHNSETPVN